MSTPLRDKIINYLSNDISQAVTASACGVSPGYISQMLDLPEVREEIAVLKSNRLEKALETDASLDKLENSALQILEKRLPYVRTAVEAVKIAQTLNGMKRKTATGSQSEDAINAAQVTITVPKGAALFFKLNETNQVIEVEGRTMAPLPSKALPTLSRAVPTLPVTDVQVIEPVPLSAFKQKQEQADSLRARQVLQDLTAYIGGVPVVL